MMFVDSHCHLDYYKEEDGELDAVVARARAAGVSAAPGFLSVSLAMMPRRIITYLRTARPGPGCCS